MSSATLDNATPRDGVSSTEDADEMIARLASEEIDRLIESEGVAPEKRANDVPSLDAAVVDSELATQAESTPPKAVAADTPATATDDAELKAEVLEAVLKDAAAPDGPDPLTQAEAAEAGDAETQMAETPAGAGIVVESAPTEAPAAEAVAELTDEPVNDATTVESPAVEVPAAETPAAPIAETAAAETAAAEVSAEPDNTSASPLLSPAIIRPKPPEYIGPPFLTATEQWKPRIEANVLADLPDLMPDWQARLLIPLIFLNRPFENLPPQTRSQIGLLALLTLFHAAVILVWALFFKH